MEPIEHLEFSDPDLAELVRRMSEAAGCYLRGEVRRYLQLVPNADDCTLMPPYGGGPVQLTDRSDEAIEQTSKYFRGGEAALEVYAAHRSADLAVLVAVERQYGLVGDFPEQDWSLRITLVYRRDDGEWNLIHRHADPLVHPIGMDQTAALARS